jgi:hypothetical protein
LGGWLAHVFLFVLHLSFFNVWLFLDLEHCSRGGIFDKGFSLSLLNILIKSISVVFDGEFSVIINLDPDWVSHCRLFILVMELSHIWMLKCLFNSHPFLRTEGQQSPQQIHSLGRRFWEETGKADSFLVIYVGDDLMR